MKEIKKRMLEGGNQSSTLRKINTLKKDLKEKKIKKILKRFYIEIWRLLFQFQSSKEKLKVVKEEWDNLIILDACRYDYFKDEYSKYLKGRLNKKNSLGGTTEEWLRKNFDKKNDIVYISANPFINNLKRKGQFWSSNFYKVVSLWNLAWDEELGTVKPERMVKEANKIIKKYPSKRKIIHFIQPHTPYITKSKEFNDSINFSALFPDKTIKNKLGEVKKAYRENLRAVLKELKELNLEGKTVISSDHGELLGEHGLFFHLKGVYFKELVEVPWLIINQNKNKNKELIKKIKL